LLSHERRTRSIRTRATRASAALAAFVVAFASLLGVVHEATTAHVRCAAHGELVDSDSDGTVRAAASASGPASAALASALPSARGHGDEHCLLASALRESRIAPRSPAIAVAIVRLADLAMTPPGQGPARAATVYRIAPKTSPPA